MATEENPRSLAELQQDLDQALTLCHAATRALVSHQVVLFALIDSHPDKATLLGKFEMAALIQAQISRAQATGTDAEMRALQEYVRTWRARIKSPS